MVVVCCYLPTTTAESVNLSGRCFSVYVFASKDVPSVKRMETGESESRNVSTRLELMVPWISVDKNKQKNLTH